MKTTFQFRPWLFVAMLCFFALPFNAQNLPNTNSEEPTPVAPPIATMEFEQTVYDFGVVESGEVVSQVYTFTNSGDEPLILMDAKGSCGCTIPEWPREPIMPGETASLVVEFNSKNKRGMRNQKVTITANTEPPQTFLYLKGEVVIPEDTEAELPEIAAEQPEVKINPDCFAIYPNPTAEILKLEMEERNRGQSATISIHSDGGQLMAKREIQTVESTIEFNVSHYPPGTYIAQVQVANRKPEARCFVVVD